MYAEQATWGNEYLVKVTRWVGKNPELQKGTCLGWNHTRTGILFVFNDGDKRFGVVIPPKDVIQTLD